MSVAVVTNWRTYSLGVCIALVRREVHLALGPWCVEVRL